MFICSEWTCTKNLFMLDSAVMPKHYRYDSLTVEPMETVPDFSGQRFPWQSLGRLIYNKR